MYNDDVETIKFQNKYVNGRALDVMTDFTHNSYIIKGSTGIGGTSALLDYKGGNVLIISPNTGMITGKRKGLYKSHKQVFIYADSQKENSLNSWRNVSNYLGLTPVNLQNLIINCTPNQIVKLRNTDTELYNQLVKIPIFIDEYHAYTTTSDFRNEMGEFLELVYNEWHAPFKLSTATPNYDNLDVFTNDAKYYNLVRADQPKKQLQISYNAKDVHEFIQTENAKGRTVVLFTNDKNYHVSNKFKNVKNLVGKNLAIKIAPYDRTNNINDAELTDCDLLVCSSAYFAGFDIKKDVSICIVSNQCTDAYKIGVNDIIQAYGRCRNTVLNALFVNVTAKYDVTTKKQTCYPTSTAEITNAITKYNNDLSYYNTVAHGATYYTQIADYEQITPQLHVNRALLLQPVFNKVINYQLYNKNVLLECLNDADFIVTDYVSSNVELEKYSNATPFKERLTNLLKLNVNVLLNSYKTAKYNLKTKDNGSFSTGLAFEYLTAYLLKSTNAELVDKLNNKRVYANEFYKSMDLFIRANVDTRYYFNQLTDVVNDRAKRLYFNDVVSKLLNDTYLTNDWQFLYMCHRINASILPENSEREINLYEYFHNVNFYKPLVSDKNQRNRTVKNLIVKELRTVNVILTDDETDWLNEISKTVFKELDATGDYINHNTRKAIKQKMINVLVFLLTNGKIGKRTENKNREYNPLTQTPKALREIIPIKMIGIDLTSANPQIVDNMLNTKVGLQVYPNLMLNRGITRNKAKKLFNSQLNNHYATVSNAKKVYLDAGFCNANATKLARMTASVEKGSFYEVMTANEKILMENYQNILPFKTFRFHDAIIMPLELVDKHNIILPTVVKDYVYHVELFNDSTEYQGLTTDAPHNGIGFVTNYIDLAS
ncbi:hypothetical protein VP395_10895 [Mariniflexile soesokkakense]|uniref:Uncharacterized protein n=1 Tax=Mariniflexile soesokkakense TaxID=1343160 RepID=A0ABV0ACG2_9FLAO